MDKNFKIFMLVIVCIISFSAIYKYINNNGIIVLGDIDKTEIKPASEIKPIPFPIITVTFDDGFYSSYDKGLPILKKHNTKATFYIISNRVGSKDYMSADQILELQSESQEIGAHTRSHLHLSTLSEKEQFDEIVGSAIDLKHLGIMEVISFAYPFGDYSPYTEGVVKKYFKNARTTKEGFESMNLNMYTLKSKVVTYDTTFSQIEKLVNDSISQKYWLILTFHRLDEAENRISSDSLLLDQALTYIQANNNPILSMAEVTSLVEGHK